MRTNSLLGMVDAEFAKATGGGKVTGSIATKITCPDKNELFAADWDLLLCSARSLSAVICEAARQLGRTAIDVGQLVQSLAQGHDLGYDSS